MSLCVSVAKPYASAPALQTARLRRLGDQWLHAVNYFMRMCSSEVKVATGPGSTDTKLEYIETA